MSLKKHVAWFAFVMSFLILFCGNPSQSGEAGLSPRDIDWCDESYKIYQQVGERTFLEMQRWSLRARVCRHLYNDPVWNYEGVGRSARLAERSGFYVDAEIEKSKQQAAMGVANPGIRLPEKEITLKQKVTQLEQKVRQLEAEIAEKDKKLSAQCAE